MILISHLEEGPISSTMDSTKPLPIWAMIFAKIMAQIGKGFVESMVELMGPSSR